MPWWSPIPPVWEGADAVIIGGGPSLRGFDFQRLVPYRTIGCNSAFRLGARVCQINLFSDPLWYSTFEEELKSYAGILVTQSEEFPDWNPRVMKMIRRDEGLHRDALGFGGNSGCSAINLALILGARRVILLGFDCKFGPNLEQNWHPYQIETIKAEVFAKFNEGFHAIARDLPRVFPGRVVINCTPGSALQCFPTAHADEVLTKQGVRQLQPQ